MTAPQRAPGVAPSVGTGAARIMDRGYRRYTGERGGVRTSMRSVVKYTAQRVLGIHRKFRFKVMPILTIVLSFVPSVVMVGIVVLTNRFEQQAGPGVGIVGRQFASQLIADYPGIYSFIVAAIALFAAFVAPEVLCTDRRTGMLGLYMASPLNRVTYLASKAAAVLMILLTVTLGPPLLMLIGYSTQGYGPSGVADWAATIGRILATGLGFALLHTLVSCAISSITTRRAAASASFIVLVMGTGALVPFLIVEAKAPVWLGAFDLLRLPLEFSYRVFGQISIAGYEGVVTPTWVIYTGFFGWIAVAGLVIWDRYRRVQVTR